MPTEDQRGGYRSELAARVHAWFLEAKGALGRATAALEAGDPEAAAPHMERYEAIAAALAQIHEAASSATSSTVWGPSSAATYG